MAIKKSPSITQYNTQFKIGKFNNERSACGLFSLLTAKKFIEDKIASIDEHNKIVDSSIANFLDLDTSGFMTFSQFLKLFKNGEYTDSNVQGTNIDLVVQGILGYDTMLPAHLGVYVTIFLKNGKYFVVMKNKDKYYLRDCHEEEQYDFDAKSEVIDHLNEKYQFNKKIDLSGENGSYEIPEWGSIEFLTITKEFTTQLDPDLKLFYKSPEEENKKAMSATWNIYFPNDYYPEDHHIPKDHQIDQRDDLIAKGQMDIQEDADAQMAMALQQAEFGDEKVDLDGLMKKYKVTGKEV